MLKYALFLYSFAMNKKILAISVAGVLALAFVLPAINANALTSAENKALKTILDLTTSAKDKLANNVQPTLTTIKQDLQFKQKFWQLRTEVEDVEEVGVRVQENGCLLPDRTACAFNVESIQVIQSPSLTGTFKVKDINIDGVETNVAGGPLDLPTNLLVDSSIGQVGASKFVEIQFCKVSGTDCRNTTAFSGTVEFNGEKPQGLKLETCTGNEGPNCGPR